MATLSGLVSDVGLDPLGGTLARLLLAPSEPFIDGSQILVGTATATITGDTWTVDLAPTPPGIYYTITAVWVRDGVEHVQTLRHRIVMPSTGGDLGDLPSVPFSTERCWLGPEPPTDRQKYPWWLKTAVTGPGDPDAASVGWLLHWKES